MIASVQRSHRAVLQMQQTSETKLLAIYKRAAADVGNRVLAMGPDADLRWLNSLMGQLEERIKALSDHGSVLVQQVKNWTFRAGVADTHRAITILPTVTLHDLALGPVQAMLDRVYHDAALALTTDVYGVKLSDLVWQSHQVTLTDMRRFMVDGMLGGKSPAELYQQMKAFLVLPDVDMRTRYWKQYFRENPPGKGRYRSAYKNVRRVLRTETNRAYRNATTAYARDKSWAQGLRWVLSYNHPEMDVCTPGATRIHTRQGTETIELIVPGTEVLTHTGGWQPVTKTFRRTIGTGPLVDLQYRERNGDVRKVSLTPNHPVLTVPLGWIRAGKMHIGMKLRCVDSWGNLANGVLVHKATRFVTKERVYNLAVAEDNSYIANGVAVHNCDMYATQENGMGPGIWSVEAVPDSGHPFCRCHLVVEINPAYLPQTEAPPPHPKPRPVPAEGPYAVPAT